MLATELLKEAKNKIILQQAAIATLLLYSIYISVKKRVDKG